MACSKKWMAVLAGLSLMAVFVLVLGPRRQSRIPGVFGTLDPKDVREIELEVSRSRWRRLRTAVSKLDAREAWEWRVPVVCSRISRLEVKRIEGQREIDVS